MQWNSGPESPREKWEYRRAQKEWDKLRQKERGAYHYQYPYAPPDVKSWTTFFANKFEKRKKISPTRLSNGFVNQFEPCRAYL